MAGVVYWDSAAMAMTTSRATAGRQAQVRQAPAQGNAAATCQDQYQLQTRSNVSYLEESNLKLMRKIKELELEIKTEKAEKKRMEKAHLAERRSRDRKEIAFLLIVASCLVMYFLRALMIRGFV